MSFEMRLKSRLKNFDLDISVNSSAKRIGILGSSGTGKSMTLKMLAGIYTPDSGYISVDGHVLYDSDHKINLKPQKRGVGYMFQNYALFPSMTVGKNISVGISRDKQAAERQEMIRSLIERFGLAGLEDNYPRELSGGQQQRVALARILASKPSVILLDEPFSALDVHLRDQMNRELSEALEDYPGLVIMVSHSRDEIYRFSEEIMVIERGKVIDYGEKKALFRNPSCVRSAILTGCKNYSRAERKGMYEVDAVDWGIRIKTKKPVPESFSYIGYRAHEFMPIWGAREDNCIPFVLDRKDELPFELNYYIRPAGLYESPNNVVSWFVQRNQWRILEEKGLPDYLKIKEEHILYLE